MAHLFDVVSGSLIVVGFILALVGVGFALGYFLKVLRASPGGE